VYFLIDRFGISENVHSPVQKTAQMDAKQQEKASPAETKAEEKKGKPDKTNKLEKPRQTIQKEYLKTIVYYFHYTARDADCRTLERLTVQTLYTCFGSQLASGKLIWRSVNMDEPWNKHFADDFNLKKRSIVIVTPAVNRRIQWKVLSDAENLAGDRAGFMKYIQTEIASYLVQK
jgi:hypothetical protein